jgi:hypothetical protein
MNARSNVRTQDDATARLQLPGGQLAAPTRATDRLGGGVWRATAENDTGGAAVAGRVVHFEVPFDDVERATSFYRDVFG